MPTYEYECDNCGNHFERFQSMSEPPVKRCPKCRHGVKRRLGTGAGIIFKGSGFYETDYRSESYKKGEKKESSAASGTKSDTKSKSDKKTNSDTSNSSSGKTGRDSNNTGGQ